MEHNKEGERRLNRFPASCRNLSMRTCHAWSNINFEAKDASVRFLKDSQVGRNVCDIGLKNHQIPHFVANLTQEGAKYLLV